MSSEDHLGVHAAYLAGVACGHVKGLCVRSFGFVFRTAGRVTETGAATVQRLMTRRSGYGFGRPDRSGLEEAVRVAAEHGMTSLARILSDPDPAARVLALQTIGELAPEGASPLLASVLHDPAPSVRVAAARTAEHVGASGAVFSLILALDDPDVSVRQASAHAVQELTGRSVTLDETSDSAARQAAIEELKVWWKEQRLAQLSKLVGGGARS